jgi:hypothetical protein
MMNLSLSRRGETEAGQRVQSAPWDAIYISLGFAF